MHPTVAAEPMKKKKALIYSHSDIIRDPRVYRQVELLRERFEVVTIGSGTGEGLGTVHYRIADYKVKMPQAGSRMRNCLSFCRRFGVPTLFLYLIFRLVKKIKMPFFVVDFFEQHVVDRRLIELVGGIDCDIAIANDITAIDIVAHAEKARKKIYDAHEYSPGQLERNKETAYQLDIASKTFQKYIRYYDETLTVCEAIAEEYAKKFRIRVPEIITNSPKYCELTPIERKDGVIEIVHHGAAVPQRKLELMVEVAKYLGDNYRIHFHLVRSNEAYFNSLVELSRRFDGRVLFHDPIPMGRLAEELNKYDVGLYILPPINFNHLNALPNKFFEYVQARLAIAIGPSPEMASYVRKYDLGVVAEDYTSEAMARAISTMSFDEIARYKRNANRYAYELSAEVQAKKFSQIIDGLLP
jgi:glycosyltransferase involved in cell wall biosynthesis